MTPQEEKNRGICGHMSFLVVTAIKIVYTDNQKTMSTVGDGASDDACLLQVSAEGMSDPDAEGHPQSVCRSAREVVIL
jgi:hypothetical protein